MAGRLLWRRRPRALFVHVAKDLFENLSKLAVVRKPIVCVHRLAVVLTTNVQTEMCHRPTLELKLSVF